VRLHLLVVDADARCARLRRDCSSLGYAVESTGDMTRRAACCAVDRRHLLVNLPPLEPGAELVSEVKLFTPDRVIA